MRSDLRTFNVEEAVHVSEGSGPDTNHDLLDVMRGDVEDGEEKHGIGDLSVEPHGLIER